MQVDTADRHGPAGLAQCPVEDELVVIDGRDHRGVVHDKAGGVGIGAVHDQLDGGGPAAAEIGLIAGVDLQDRGGIAGVDQAPRHGFILGVGNGVKVRGPGEPGDERAARGRLVAVQHPETHVAHVQAHGIAEDQRLDHRQPEDDQAHARIPEDGEELLAKHRTYTFPHGHGLLVNNALLQPASLRPDPPSPRLRRAGRGRRPRLQVSLLRWRNEKRGTAVMIRRDVCG